MHCWITVRRPVDRTELRHENFSSCADCDYLTRVFTSVRAELDRPPALSPSASPQHQNYCDNLSCDQFSQDAASVRNATAERPRAALEGPGQCCSPATARARRALNEVRKARAITFGYFTITSSATGSYFQATCQGLLQATS